MSEEDRAQVLLRATYDLLTRLDKGQHVTAATCVWAHYQGKDSDGMQLKEDIRLHLGLDRGEPPIPLAIGTHDGECIFHEKEN